VTAVEAPGPRPVAAATAWLLIRASVQRSRVGDALERTTLAVVLFEFTLGTNIAADEGRDATAEEQGSPLLAVISIILTAASVPIGGILSFWTYSLPDKLLLPAPYTGWTVFIIATILWCIGLICAIGAVIGKPSAISKLALLLALSAPVLVIALATAIFMIALHNHPFTF
jgi:hypothetical protein